MSSLAGHLLIAPQSERDPDFVKTVILLIQHSEQQAVGVVLNRPSSKRVNDVWTGKRKYECHQSVYSGGPVPGPLMAVHTCRPLGEIEVLPGVHYSVQKKHLEALVQQTDQRFRLFDGHAGWGPGQLEKWLEAKGFRILPATVEQTFASGTNLWDEVAE